MINESKGNVITKIGEQSSSKFQINATAEAFDALSSGLYSNPIAAVLRELGTNAYDAHILAGKKDLPFKVILPNKLSPTLVVRDFGPGLSLEQLNGIYRTYFDSSKNDSNEFNGMFGVGSKSPFTMCDSFMVTSFHAEGTYICSIIKDEEGCPDLLIQGKLPPNGETGLEISIPIKMAQIGQFAQEAIRIFSPFETRPETSASLTFPKTKINELFRDDYSFVKENSDWFNVFPAGISILMGNVIYPVTVENCPKDYVDLYTKLQSSLTDYTKYSYKYNKLVIKLPIGSVNIALSREALRYTQKTITTLKDKFQFIIDNETKTYRDSLSKAQTGFEKALIDFEALSLVKNLLSLNESKKIDSWYKEWQNEEKDIKYDLVKAGDLTQADWYKNELDNPSVEFQHIHIPRYGSLARIKHFDYNSGNYIKSDLVVIINDTLKKTGKPNKDHMFDRISQIVDWNSKPVVILTSQLSDDEIEKRTQIPKRMYLKLSSVPKIKKERVATGTAGYKGHYIWQDEDFKKFDIDPTSKNIYGVIKENDHIFLGQEKVKIDAYSKRGEINQFFVILNHVKDKDDVIIITTPQKSKKIPNLKKIDDLLAKIDDDQLICDLVKTYKLRSEPNKILHKLKDYPIKSNKEISFINVNAPPRWLCKKIVKKIEDKITKLEKDHNVFVQNIRKKKPLFDTLIDNIRYPSDKDKKLIIEYLDS